ncbi:MAG: hypothetical protein CME71_01495 [Halobacteriovorax sp.]|nr:hypothetical protein [Halobacteriovorax sp.]
MLKAIDLYTKCFTQVWKALSVDFREKEVEIDLNESKGAQELVGSDAELVERALGLVLKSALTQTLRGTEVRVTVGSSEGKLAVCIRDHGPGMEDHQFEPLYSTDRLQQWGIICKAKSHKFDEYPDDHGTSLTIVF